MFDHRHCSKWKLDATVTQTNTSLVGKTAAPKQVKQMGGEVGHSIIQKKVSC